MFIMILHIIKISFRTFKEKIMDIQYNIGEDPFNWDIRFQAYFFKIALIFGLK